MNASRNRISDAYDFPCARTSKLRCTNHVTEFDTDGYVALSRFLDRRETAEVQALVEPAVRLSCDSVCKRPQNMLSPLRWNDPIVQRIVRSKRRMQALRDATDGGDLKWISGYISIKEAFSPALWWHQNWWCWDYPVIFRREAPQIAVLCYLTDTSIHNGALRVLPGSHRKSVPIHSTLPEAHSQSAGGLGSEHVAMNGLPDQSTPGLRAGDAVALDYRLLHGTHPNSSNGRPDCILLSFTPSRRRLPEDIRAHLIDHPALPLANEATQASQVFPNLLPAFEGERRSLALNRNAPPEFKISCRIPQKRFDRKERRRAWIECGRSRRTRNCELRTIRVVTLCSLRCDEGIAEAPQSRTPATDS
jgi:hypothetical protein